MPELSSVFTIWLPILLASWVSFVKSSVQAAIYLALIFLITQRFELFLATVFLLFVSLLIPRPNPRHQKRRFQFGKAFYVILTGYTAWILSHLVSKLPLIQPAPVDMNLLTLLMPPLSIFVLVIVLLFTRYHVH